MNAEFLSSVDWRYNEIAHRASIEVRGSLNRNDGFGIRDIARINKSDPGGDATPV